MRQRIVTMVNFSHQLSLDALFLEPGPSVASLNLPSGRLRD